MAESFGNKFTVVEVSSDNAQPRVWVARAKPSQAITLVLAAAPEGATAEILDVTLAPALEQQFEGLNLDPGDVCEIGLGPIRLFTK